MKDARIAELEERLEYLESETCYHCQNVVVRPNDVWGEWEHLVKGEYCHEAITAHGYIAELEAALKEANGRAASNMTFAVEAEAALDLAIASLNSWMRAAGSNEEPYTKEGFLPDIPDIKA